MEESNSLQNSIGLALLKGQNWEQRRVLVPITLKISERVLHDTGKSESSDAQLASEMEALKISEEIPKGPGQQSAHQLPRLPRRLQCCKNISDIAKKWNLLALSSPRPALGDIGLLYSSPCGGFWLTTVTGTVKNSNQKDIQDKSIGDQQAMALPALCQDYHSCKHPYMP